MGARNLETTEPKRIFSILPGMTDDDFLRFSRLVYSICGIKLPPQKKTMLEGRLRKRLRALGMASFEEYSEYLFNQGGLDQELIQLINEVTTNKTDFFREPAHFDLLKTSVIPNLISTFGAGIDRPLRVWSAGCSSGEEPYTLAMVMEEFGRTLSGFRFSIMATDISTKVLEKAALGIYALDKVFPVPEDFKKRYLLRSKDKSQPRARVTPELRSHVTFRRLNFMDGDFGITETFDVIFCRNVIIYFDRATQEKLLRKLCSHIPVGGYLFMGHSESLNGMNLPLMQVAPSAYRRK